MEYPDITIGTIIENNCTCGAPEAEPGDVLEYEHAEECPMGQ